MSTTETQAPEVTPGVAQNDYTSLTVEAHRNEVGGYWEFGVRLSGAYVVIATRKLGGVDDDIRESIQPGFKAARAAASLLG